jgi:hypothetical protein
MTVSMEPADTSPSSITLFVIRWRPNSSPCNGFPLTNNSPTSSQKCCQLALSSSFVTSWSPLSRRTRQTHREHQPLLSKEPLTGPLTNRAVSRNTPLAAREQVLHRARTLYLSACSHCPRVPLCVPWCVMCGRRVHELSSLCVPSTLLPRTEAHEDRTVIVPVTVRVPVTLLSKCWCASRHLAAPPRPSPSLPLSICSPPASSSSSCCSSPGVLESGVRMAVAALDREIQHLHEYRNNGASRRPAAPTMDGPSVPQHAQEIMGSLLQPCERAGATCWQHSPSHPSSFLLYSSAAHLSCHFPLSSSSPPHPLPLPRPHPFWGSVRIV